MGKRKSIDSSDYLGAIIGNELSSNVQNGTNEAIKGMDLLRSIAKEKYNVDYAQKKGNLFEFIEAAKFNKNSANAGKSVRAIVTHADGRPHAPADIELVDGGRIIDSVQAKVSDKATQTAFDFKDPKYADMQRITVSDNVKRVKELTDKRTESGSLYSSDYENSKKNITDSLTDRRDGTNSGGTSKKELELVSDNTNAYATHYEINQYVKEVGITAVNSAASSMIVSGSVSAIQNMFEYCKGKKNLNEALKEIGVTTVKSGTRGLATGGFSGVLRMFGAKNSIPLLQDTNVAVTLANGFLDTGVSIYSFTKGEIDSNQLKSQLTNTTIKSVSTIYFTKAIAASLGATPFFAPFAVYTISSYGFSACQAIIRDSKLKAAEYNKIAALYVEYNKQIAEQRAQMEEYFENYIKSKQQKFSSLLDIYEENLFLSGNYDTAVCAINSFATDFGMSLKYVDFKDFDKMMKSNKDLRL